MICRLGQKRHKKRPNSCEIDQLAESGGFEPPIQFNPYDSLANCWFQPLTQLSRTFKPGLELTPSSFCPTNISQMKRFLQAENSKPVLSN